MASAAARVKTLKAAHLTAKKAARAAAAAATASAAAAVASAGAAVAAAILADNACNSDACSAAERMIETAGRRQPEQQQHRQERRWQASSTSGNRSADKRKKDKKRVNTKPCVFFLRGHCRHGDGCRFSHDVVREEEEEGGEEEEEDEEKGATLGAKEAALDKAERKQVRLGPSILRAGFGEVVLFRLCFGDSIICCCGAR